MNPISYCWRWIKCRRGFTSNPKEIPLTAPFHHKFSHPYMQSRLMIWSGSGERALIFTKSYHTRYNIGKRAIVHCSSGYLIWDRRSCRTSAGSYHRICQQSVGEDSLADHQFPLGAKSNSLQISTHCSKMRSNGEWSFSGLFTQSSPLLPALRRT